MKRLMLSVIAGVFGLAALAPEACGQAWRRPAFQPPRPVFMPQAARFPRPVAPPAAWTPRPTVAPSAARFPRPGAAGAAAGFRQVQGARPAAVVIGPRAAAPALVAARARVAAVAPVVPPNAGPGPDSVLPAGFSPPQAPPVPAAGSGTAPSVAGTTWAGRETLRGFGALVFVLADDGRATMADAATMGNGGQGRTVSGNWQQSGADVVIRFGDCVYRGRVNGDWLSGTAAFTTGQSGAWTFQVRLQPSQPDAGSAAAADPGR
jgi:hypothetical protein